MSDKKNVPLSLPILTALEELAGSMNLELDELMLAIDKIDKGEASLEQKAELLLTDYYRSPTSKTDTGFFDDPAQWSAHPSDADQASHASAFLEALASVRKMNDKS